jgi:dihydrofolate synthase/folylpolyglutamate synthase
MANRRNRSKIELIVALGVVSRAPGISRREKKADTPTSQARRNEAAASAADRSFARPRQWLLAKLGDRRLPPCVHIAVPTAGSVTAYLKAMIEASGARVHVYTSPHLVRFHERIELAGADGQARSIAEDTLVDVLVRTQATNGRDDITQFEITTAAAFLAFAEHPADVLLLEVGLGGRLDATNVVDGRRSTSSRRSRSITREAPAPAQQIAYEKAGILRQGCRPSSRSRSRRRR